MRQSLFHSRSLDASRITSRDKGLHTRQLGEGDSISDLTSKPKEKNDTRTVEGITPSITGLSSWVHKDSLKGDRDSDQWQLQLCETFCSYSLTFLYMRTAEWLDSYSCVHTTLRHSINTEIFGQHESMRVDWQAVKTRTKWRSREKRRARK